MKLRLFAALLISMISAQAFAINVDCKVEIAGKVVQQGVHELEQIPDEGEGAAVGVIFEDQLVQVVVSNYPLQVNINELRRGRVVRSTKSPDFFKVLTRMDIMENRAISAVRVGPSVYRVTCHK